MAQARREITKAKYSTVRLAIRTGDVFLLEVGNLFKGKFEWGLIKRVAVWVFMKLIELWTWSRYSHTGIACWITFEDSLGNKIRHLCIFDSFGLEPIRIAPMDKLIEDGFWKIYWMSLGENMVSRNIVIDFCLPKWRKKYANIRQFVLFVVAPIRWIRSLLGFGMDTDEDRWHCSELVAAAIKAGGYPYEKSTALTTPEDVSRFSCLANPVLLEKD